MTRPGCCAHKGYSKLFLANVIVSDIGYMFNININFHLSFQNVQNYYPKIRKKRNDHGRTRTAGLVLGGLRSTIEPRSQGKTVFMQWAVR
jgi:hypothetical protein